MCPCRMVSSALSVHRARFHWPLPPSGRQSNTSWLITWPCLLRNEKHPVQSGKLAVHRTVWDPVPALLSRCVSETGKQLRLRGHTRSLRGRLVLGPRQPGNCHCHPCLSPPVLGSLCRELRETGQQPAKKRKARAFGPYLSELMWGLGEQAPLRVGP